jgi:hypothetical protein
LPPSTGPVHNLFQAGSSSAPPSEYTTLLS